jgi:hypothetical protein
VTAQMTLPYLGAPGLTCPWCGTEEASEWLLTNNHWVRPAGDVGYDWCGSNQQCIAQSLTGNHVRYYARALRDRNPRAAPSRKTTFDEAATRACLEQAVARARSLNVDTDAILTEIAEDPA